MAVPLLRHVHKLLFSRPNSSLCYAANRMFSAEASRHRKKSADEPTKSNLNNPPNFPSDIEEDLEDLRREARQEKRKKQAESELHEEDAKDENKPNPSICLFPGQGSQFVGMGKKLLKHSNVEAMYEVASDILGYNLLDICLKGPRMELSRTIYCQPAILVTSLAAVQALNDTQPQVIENCVSTAGYSVGEITALTFADAIDFEDAVRLVKSRAEFMEEASEKVPSGMLTVILGPDNRLKVALEGAEQYCRDKYEIAEPVCVNAIDLYPEVKVVAGHNEALEFIQKYGSDFGIRRTKRVAVSGAFHTAIMGEAQEKYTAVLKDIPLRKPLIPVYSNVTGKQFHSTKDIRKLLAKQLCTKVKWEQTMHQLYHRPATVEAESFPDTYEVGPGMQLGAMLKKKNAKAHEVYYAVTC